MQLRSTFSLLALLTVCPLLTVFHGQAHAQFFEATPEHKVLQKDVGIWEATTKMWIGADGKPDPTAEPVVSLAAEVNRMLGDYWLVSDFKGTFAGVSFEGHSTMGYDPKKQVYVGTWTDSISPYAMSMVGTYDKASDTMTLNSKGVDLEGKEVTGKMVVKYNQTGRVMTMYDIIDGKEVKTMEVTYTKAKK